MSLIKKIDVEAHFAERRRMRLAALGFAGKPAAKGALAPEASGTKADVPGFKQSSSIEHSSPKIL